MSSAKPNLGMRSVFLRERMERFIEDHAAKGFSEEEIFLLASMHSLLDRKEIKPSQRGRFSLVWIMSNGCERLSKALESVHTPSDLAQFRSELVHTWAAPSWRDNSAQGGILRVMKFINNNQFQQLLEAWAASDTPPLPQGKTLKEALTPLFTRKELDIPQESTPNRSTKDIVAEAGLHAFSWNSWLYEPHEEPWVAQQLAAVHVALEDMTGLKGPVLGLNGWSSLHLDDDRQSSFGVMQISTYERTKRIGKNHFGKSFIRLSSAAGWTTLGHEWIHALDVAMHLGKRGSVAGYLSETEDTMQEWIQRMEATPQGQTSDDVARWVRGHQAALAAYKDSPSLSDEPSIPPALAIIDKIDGGEIVENLAEEYRKQNDPGYFGLWSERLAYAYNRGAQRLGGLPLLLNTVVSPWLLGTPAEQEVAGDVFQEFFASNMVKDFWQALNTSPEDSFLLDAVARRRMKRDRAYQRDKRKAAAPSA